MTEGKPLVLLQVNWRIMYNKAFDFWNLIDTYNPDVLGTDSWLSEESINAEVFRADYATFKRDGHSCGDRVFMYVK
jgi:hypothetical protein